AEELERWLRGEPVQARTVHRVARAWRWAHRNPWPTGLLVLATLAAAAATTGALLIWQQKQAKEAALARAEARTAFAGAAAEDMYTQVAEKWLADEPHMTEVQREFLLKALKLFEELAKERSTDPAVQLETAKAYFRVARIHEQLGDDQQAETAFGQ